MKFTICSDCRDGYHGSCKKDDCTCKHKYITPPAEIPVEEDEDEDTEEEA